MASGRELFTTLIEDTKDPAAIQQQFVHSKYSKRSGLYVLEWDHDYYVERGYDLSAGQQFHPLVSQQELGANEASLDKFFIPAGMIITSAIYHTHQSLGSGTAVLYDTIGGLQSISAFAGSYLDITSAFFSGSLIDKDREIWLQLTGAFTSGSLSLYIKYFRGNAD